MTRRSYSVIAATGTIDGMTTGLIDDEATTDTAASARKRAGRRRWVPWSGPATRTDKALLAVLVGVVAFGLVMRPLRPFLIANHPVLLEFLTGGLATIGAAAAFARIGEVPLWLVIVAGVAGMIKLDWLTWWAGRQWGRGIIGYFTTADRAERYSERAQRLRPWMLGVAVIGAGLPGIPSAVVFALAGWTRMRLVTFLLLDALGALLMTSLVAGLGYALGQSAVDLVLLIDKYASWVSIGILATAALVPMIKKGLRVFRRRRAR